MKKIFGLIVIMAMVLVFSMQAHAGLTNLGTDSLGNRLIYDSDLDITWYDYTKSYNTWLGQVNWASGLSVNFGGNVYDDWRLPSTVDGVGVFGYDGSYPTYATIGYNITSTDREMSHLFYTELGNLAAYDTSGNPTPEELGWGLTNTGDFQNLQPYNYWSGIEYSIDPNAAWNFGFGDGLLQVSLKGNEFYALAVRDGLAVVPEPVSSILFVTGAATLGIRRYWKKKKTA